MQPVGPSSSSVDDRERRAPSLFEKIAALFARIPLSERFSDLGTPYFSAREISDEVTPSQAAQTVKEPSEEENLEHFYQFLKELKWGSVYQRKESLAELEYFSLERPQVKALPESMRCMRALKQLHIRKTKIQQLPSLDQFKSLRVLVIKDNINFNTFPSSIFCLENLLCLTIENSSLTALPEEGWERLSKLREMHIIDSKQLIAVSEGITRLPHIGILDLSWNQLSCLPQSMGRMQSLQTLVVSGNQLTSLPTSMAQLQISVLDLESNQLSTLEGCLGKQLRDLVVSRNFLTQLPETLPLTLEALIGDVNLLTSLPDDFGKLRQLSKCYLPGNHLTCLPQSMGGLCSLNELNVSNNEDLHDFPDSLGHCYSLRSLDARETRVSPERVRHLFQQATALAAEMEFSEIDERSDSDESDSNSSDSDESDSD